MSNPSEKTRKIFYNIIAAAIFFLAGAGIARADGYDFRTLKYPSDGSAVEFNKVFDSGKNDFAKDTAIDSNDSVYVAGSCYNKHSSLDEYDACIMKYDSSGNPDTVWGDNGLKIINTGFSDQVRAITVDSSDYVYVVTDFLGVSNRDLRIFKFDSSGN